MKAAYDDISPITGNYKVLIDPVEDQFGKDNYCLCMDSGYHTYEKMWKKGNVDIIKNVEKNYPDFISDKKVVDSKTNVWYPMMSQILGVTIFPKVNEDGDLMWNVYKAKPASQEDIENEDNIISTATVYTEDGPKLVFQKLTEQVIECEMLEFEKAFDAFSEIQSEIFKHYSDEEE